MTLPVNTTKPIRTRFSPSPTGNLHIGGVRTALFSWLYARHTRGCFLLRIEDTDSERSTPEAIQVILESLTWLGLNYDEGPYFQSKRLAYYQAALNQLLEQGKAYRCYCSQERLAQLREQQLAKKQKPRYDGFCRDRQVDSSSSSFVIRFRTPQTGTVTVHDVVFGPVTFQNKELDDLIIARSDGSPTYNFTVVVDDWKMAITHVIRGDDHLNNTPRQINLFLALGVDLPIYAHVPMVLAADGRKLSKRYDDASILSYREAGYLPEAVLNYLLRLGWSKGDKEIFSLEELIECFDINSLNRSPALMNSAKLTWLNQHYLKTLDPKKVAQSLHYHMQQLKLDTIQGPCLTEVVLAQRERVKTLKEMAEKSQFFYCDRPMPTPSIALPPVISQALQKVFTLLSSLPDWHKANLHDCLMEAALEYQLTLGQLMQPLRLLLTGTTASPPMDLTLALLGKKRVLARLQRFLFE